ncbi:MAG: arginine--tRNA ligase [Candidatus Woesearchaeota archaeon]
MDFKDIIANIVHKELDYDKSEILKIIEIPPNSELGDYSMPCFVFSKALKKSPQNIALELKDTLTKINISEDHKHFELINNVGAYLNFFVNKKEYSKHVLNKIYLDKYSYGSKKRNESDSENKNVVLIESPSPNTNKPLHIGHLRNILLGQSIYNILKFIGKTPYIVNVVNDRGVHICKSMLAYEKFGMNETPETAHKKSDHFVGDYYVKYSMLEKDNPEIEKEVQEMLLKWEDNDPKIRALWAKMNNWAIKGFRETFKSLDFNIDKDYFESELYLHGKDIILKGLEDGVFEKDDTGAVIANFEDIGLGKKVLLRANGTSIYITQDIYLAKKRYEEYNFEEMVYIVGNEQEYHFKILFEIFKKLKWKFSDKCYHFSYGMIELPEGKLKSREGKVIDTDNLLIEVKNICIDELKKRYENLSETEINERAKIISMSAIRFFFLKFDPLKNFVYNPKESLSFDGETGPYIEYSYARINSIFKKLKDKEDIDLKNITTSEEYFKNVDVKLLSEKNEFEIIKLMDKFPLVIIDSAKNFKPSMIAHYLLELAQKFNEFYHSNQILSSEDKNLIKARIYLIYNIQIILKIGLNLLHITEIDEM